MINAHLNYTLTTLPSPSSPSTSASDMNMNMILLDDNPREFHGDVCGESKEKYQS